MKTTKKALSVLLAVIMIMSSMSVCFGSFSFTASAAISDDTISQLKEALQSDLVTKAGNTDNTDGVKVTTSYGSGTGDIVNTVTIETSTYAAYVSLKDIVILMDKAIKETNEWKNKDNTDDVKNPGRACTSTYHIEVELLDSLESNGLALTEPIKKFIQYFLRSSGAVLHENAENYRNSARLGNPSATHSSVPNSYANTVIVKTTDYKGYLATRGAYTNVESTITLGYTYTLKMWELFYAYSGSGFLAQKYRCIHNMFYNSKGGFDAPSVYTPANKTGVDTELKNHVSVINTFTAVSFEDLLAKVSDGTIDTYLSDFNTAVANAKNYVGGEATYNKLFSSFAADVANQMSSIQSAKDMQTYIPIAESYEDFVAANPNYGRFNWGEGGGANNWGIFGEKGSATHAQMEADYLTFKGYYDSIVNGGTKVLDYFVNSGKIDMQYLYNFTDNYKVYYLNDSRNAADEFYNTYKDTYKDYTTEEQVVLLSQVTGFIDSIPTYRSNVRGGELEVINAIYNEGYGYLLDLQEDLKVEVNEFVLYFAENAHKSFVDLKTKEVWAKVDEAITKRSGLESFYNTLSSARRDQLLGAIRTDANHMVQGLYQLLGNRFTSEVDTAYALYTELGKPSSVTVETFLKLNAVLLAIETDIMADLDGRNQGGYITDATRAKYEEMRVSIIPVCDAFRTTYGFNSYKQTYIADKNTGIYPEDRGLYTGDEVKTQPYVVDKAKMNQLIAALDKIINSDLVGSLLGGLLGVEEGEEFNLGDALTDLIKGALFTDDFINTVVQLLYPLVLGEFEDVFADLPSTVDVTDPISVTVDVFYEKTLWNVLNETGFALYPDLMANTLASKYQDNIDKLKAAKQNWESVAIRDPETKKLTLEWGVAEQKEKLDAGEITMEEFETFFYNAFEDATKGILPLLSALITNVEWKPNNVSRIAYAEKNILIYNIQLQVDLQLGATPNDGYANLLIPIYEALGLTSSEYTAASSVRGSTDISWVLETILAPIFTFVEKLSTNPVEQILSILPNLIYSTAFNMVPALLNMLQTTVTYQANEVSLGVGTVLNGGADVFVGDMLITDDEGALLPKSMFTGGLRSILANFGINIPEIDQATLATLGSLDKINTQRAKYIYSGLEGTGKAYHINADKADVGYYLLSYILGLVQDEAAFTSLLGMFMTKDVDGEKVADEEKIAGVKKVVYETLNLDEMDVGDAIAAIVELANQIEYGVDPYYWYAGENNSPVGSSAAEIYLNPENDWTEAKADYLYKNLDTLVASILTMAIVDLDAETEGVQNNLGEMLGGLIGGLLGDKTLTALANLLAGLDLNALLSGSAEDEAATVAEGDEEESALNIADILNDLLVNELGIDLSVYTAEGSVYAQIKAAVEADPEYVHNFGVDSGDKTFAEVLAEMLAPAKPLLDFILGGEDLTLIDSAITLHGYKGYDNALIPLLEALGATPAAYTDGADTLKLTVDALVARIEALTTGDVIKNIIDLLPGVVYYLSSNGLSQGLDKLLTPVYAILDTIRPIYNLNLAEMIAAIEVGEEGDKKPLGLDIKNLNLHAILTLVKDLVGLDLTGLAQVAYDVSDVIGAEYNSVSTLNSTFKKGAYNDNFSQADMLTVVLSFVLEWATVKENAEKLDELLKTNGLISSITTVLAGVKVNYTDPNWMYWFDTEEEFNDYVNGEKALPNTLLALEYPNDWNDVTAQYIADNLASLVDMVIGLINKDKEDAPKTVADLLGGLLNGYLTKDSLNQLVDLIVNLLSNIDATLINTAGVLLDANIAGLETYEAPEIVATEDTTLTEAFAAELANVLDTYAGRIIDWLFFADSYEFARKSTGDDTIVINGGLGYEKGLAMILEALGCDLPANPDVYTVLGALAARVDEILAAPVDEVLDLLPNLVYFLNANGAGAAVSNILAPVVALINALEIEGFKLDLADLIKIKKDDGTEVKLNLGALTLANIVNFVESLTGLNLTAVKNILVDFCVGKIEKGTYIYKMTADKADVVTIVLTTALLVLKNEQNADVIGADIIKNIQAVFNSAPVTYVTPNWDYSWDEDDIDYVYGTIGVIESALNYPNDWTEETSQYVAANLSKLVDMVIGLIEIDGTKYESLAALIDAKLNIYTEDNLKAIQTALGDLIGGLDGDLKNIVDVALGAADSLLGADVQGLLDYDVSGVNDKASFVAALTGMLMEVEGLVDWLLLGEDYELFVDDDGNMVYEDGEAIITLNGGHGYAEGLALLLEALGCEDLPTVYDKNTIDTEATVKAVLTSLANRIDEVLDNPVDEVIDLLPNLIYFLNANGVAAVIDNLTGAFTALATKLKGFGLDLDLNALINIPALMKIEDKYAEGDRKISLDNLAMKDILKAVSLMTGLDLTVLEGTLNGFALGNIQAYPSVSRTGATFKMQYEDAFDKADMITVLVTAVLNVLETGDNAEKIDKMANTNLVSAIRDVFMGGTVVYTAPNWDYTNDTKYEVKYPNNWTEATAEYVADNLVEIGDMIAGLIDANYATLGELLTDKVNVFTSDNLDKLVELINNFLGDIDATLIEGAGLLLGAKLVGDDSLAKYKAPADIDTAEEFATELANVLSTYAPGVVEWLFLGESYKFFVNDANGDDKFNNGKYTEGEDVITINGAQGYAEGLALLLEALGCEKLPEVYDAEGNALELDTAETIEAVLVSLGKRIDYILANPVVEVVNLLPNLFYFLNTNGVAAIVDNLTAGITALLGKLEAFGVKLNINDLVNLQKLMGIEGKGATISLDNLAMKDILQAVSLMVGIDLTYIEKVLVNFNLGEVAAYDSVSQYAGETKKMTYVTTFEDHDMITVIANLLLITLADAKNEAVIKDLLGEKIYTVILNIINREGKEAPVQNMNWQGVPEKVGQIFNALETSPTYKGFEYGPLYTEEMAQYIADNIGEFINNIIYLLGLEINGVNVESLEDLLNNLVGGSLYNSSLVITIRDALAGLATSIEGLEVEGKNVGKLIVKVLETAEIADLKAIGEVAVPEFEDNREMFVESLCNVLEPAYGLLTWLLTDKDLAFFVDTDKSNFITLPGAEGYNNGIALLLEAIGCEPTALAKRAEGEALVKAILNPLLNRLDEIFANPAEEILAVLTNVIYFINSNGVDVVIKNTLNAVYTVLAAIEPIAKVDLYKLVGLDAYVTLSAEELIDMLLSKLEVAGFDFTAISVDFFSELTIGKLTQYTSISAEGANAYKMVYDAEYANEAHMITAVMRLVITFILTDNNREVLVDLLKDVLGMSADAEKYVRALLKAFADSIVGKKGEDLRLGMDSVLATIYYIFYGLDTGVDNTVAGKKDLDKLWAAKIKELNDNSPSENTQVGDLITDIFDILFNDEDENGNFPVGGGNDVADKEEIAPNGFIAFFQRIAKFFEEIGEFFRNLFSFGK